MILLSIFIDRKNELPVLNERHQQKGAEFIILYGRRLTAKSERIVFFPRGESGFSPGRNQNTCS